MWDHGPSCKWHRHWWDWIHRRPSPGRWHPEPWTDECGEARGAGWGFHERPLCDSTHLQWPECPPMHKTKITVQWRLWILQKRCQAIHRRRNSFQVHRRLFSCFEHRFESRVCFQGWWRRDRASREEGMSLDEGKRGWKDWNTFPVSSFILLTLSLTLCFTEAATAFPSMIWTMVDFTHSEYK